MKKAVILFLLVGHALSAQVDLSYYLPADVTYNPSIPKPQDILGYVPGEWHVSHDQLLMYVRAMDAASDRISIEPYAKSHEGRQLLQLIITSEDNHKNLKSLKAARSEVKSGKEQTGPLVVQLGYSVHGNEASGSNASLLTIYYLAAAQGPKIDRLLKNTIILLDPSFNPDGLNRFASWVNTHKSYNINPDPNDREYNEVWPGGRTNHYWFDLNRDWMPVQHPESQGRIRQFHSWMPHVLTDHHEMGTSGTFFFQPGIPSRKFPNTDDRNPQLTGEIARFHAKALDSIGSLYYSKESFDDFYVGKGSTYPDVNGSIGILFEQASARGHAQESPYGTLTFPFAIRNHFVTSLSTLEAGLNMADQLKKYQAQQYRDAAKWSSPGGYVFGDKFNQGTTLELVRILKTPDIRVNELKSTISVGGNSFEPGSSYLVSMNQPQARLIKSVFETRKTFTDSLFYDISSWTLPLAMNVPYAELEAKGLSAAGGEMVKLQLSGKRTGNSDYAYVFKTTEYFSHRAINRLLEAGIVLRVMESSHGAYPAGSVVVPVGVQREKKQHIELVLDEIAQKDGLTIEALQTGLAVSGIDLGSPSMSILQPLRTALIVDEGVDYTEAGEAWHVIDQRLQMKVTLLSLSEVSRIDLGRYNRIIMTDGRYQSLGKNGAERLKEWVQKGGVLIAWKSAGSWLSTNELSKVQYEKTEDRDTKGKSYSQYDSDRGSYVTGGSIFQANLDLSHPLAYGFTKSEIPLFRDHNLVMKAAENGYSQPLSYSTSPLLSGYFHRTNLEKLKGTPGAQVTAIGSGRVIVLADNPNFRAFWYGTNKLFFNALFFGHTIASGTAR